MGAAPGRTIDWSWLTGRAITSVQSDLQSIVLTLEGGQTLVVRSELYQGAPFLSFAPKDEKAGTLTGAAAGCTVDWSWLTGRAITSVQSDLQPFVLTLRDGRTLVVRAELYQRAPFLSFTPWVSQEV